MTRKEHAVDRANNKQKARAADRCLKCNGLIQTNNTKSEESERGFLFQIASSTRQISELNGASVSASTKWEKKSPYSCLDDI